MPYDVGLDRTEFLANSATKRAISALDTNEKTPLMPVVDGVSGVVRSLILPVSRQALVRGLAVSVLLIRRRALPSDQALAVLEVINWFGQGVPTVVGMLCSANPG